MKIIIGILLAVSLYGCQAAPHEFKHGSEAPKPFGCHEGVSC
jgi:hypothetical protein